MSNFSYFNELVVASEFVSRTLGTAEIGLVLGSGLAGFTQYFTNRKRLAFKDIPGMPKTSVQGHSGELVLGDIANLKGESVKVLCFSGRVHAYEGWAQSKINFLCRLAMMVGCRAFILTNSAGGCLKGMDPGSIMVIRDFLRLTSAPLMIDLCEDQRFGPRELQTKGIFSEYLTQVAREAAKDTGIHIHEGVYCWTSGPTYETHAEVQAGIKLGAGAFGMSTVPEALATAACGMELFGISLATNLAAGLINEELTHEEVTRVARESGPKFEKLLLQFLKKLDLSKVKTPARPSHHMELSTYQRLHDQYSFWPQPFHVQKDFEYARSSNQNAETPKYLICAFSQDLDWLSSLANTRVLLLKDLPFFSQIAQTPAACNGYMIFGDLDASKRALLLSSGNRVEGFSNVESFYLIALARFFGIDCLLTSFPSIEVNGNANSLLLLNDFVDRSDHHLPPNLAAFKFLGTYSPKLSVLNKNLLSKTSEVDSFMIFEGALLTIPGPSIPSLAEISSAKLAQCSAVGISGTSILSCANAFGITSVALLPVLKYSDFENATHGVHCKALSLAQKVLFDSIKHIDYQSRSGDSFDFKEINWIPHPKLVQENFDQVAAAVEFLKSSLSGANFGNAIFLESHFLPLLSQFNATQTLKCSDIPYWNLYCTFPHGQSWNLHVVSLQNDSATKALIFSNSSFSSGFSYSVFEMRFAVRVSSNR
jgi:purine-nucleoside phosphorylase